MSETRVDVAVVGGGPAGIAAACELRRRKAGRVVVLDREATAGGTPRHCGHPPFGWREFGRILTGPAYARKLAERAQMEGVELLVRHTVVALREGGVLQVATPEGLLAIHARRVILATGARESPPSARLISGDRPLGCLTTGALQAYIHLEGLLPFRRPLIVGTEYVSMSALLTCRRAGIRPVAMIESSRRPTVPRAFAWLPGLMRIPSHFGAEIAGIFGRGRVERVVVRLASGEVRDFACDGVLFTGRFVPEAAIAQASHLVMDAGSRGPSIDQYGRCSDPAYFAAGNVLRAVETAGWSYAEGAGVGRIVAADLAGELPERARELSVARGVGVKLVVPQRIMLPVNGSFLGALQLRLDRGASGRVLVEVDEVPVWQKAVNGLPERRVLVPLSDIRLPANAASIRVALQPDGAA
jgi:NADPH-dependent 2,4-dienoyl-CoA reductase/sulfur reductase-like enzyme